MNFFTKKNKHSKYFEYDLSKPAKNKDEKIELLDPNHSNFILVDNAQHNFGGEVKFRASLEAKIAQTHQIPIVVLVIGGGPRTAKSIYQALEKGTPCVVLEVFELFSDLTCAYL